MTIYNCEYGANLSYVENLVMEHLRMYHAGKNTYNNPSELSKTGLWASQGIKTPPEFRNLVISGYPEPMVTTKLPGMTLIKPKISIDGRSVVIG